MATTATRPKSRTSRKFMMMMMMVMMMMVMMMMEVVVVVVAVGCGKFEDVCLGARGRGAGLKQNIGSIYRAGM